jgi:hypothetical protein
VPTIKRCDNCKGPRDNNDESLCPVCEFASNKMGVDLVTDKSKCAEILDTAKGLITGARRQTYGTAKEDFTRTGQLWGVVLGISPVPAWKVALCLSMIKVSRLVATSGAHEDSWVDGCGYLALGGEIGIPTAPLGDSFK